MIDPIRGDNPIASAIPVNTVVTLAEQARRLADEVAGMRESAVKLARRTGRNEWALRFTVLGLALDIVLSVFAFVLLNNQSASNARLEASIHESCTLYAFIIPSYRETVRATSPLGPDGYDQFYRAMQTSADHLNCGIPHRI